MAASAWSLGHIASGRSIAVVPTMGAIHNAHLALVAEAKTLAEVVIVTIFVNPLQFNVTADFDNYPRPVGDDLDLCAHAGVDAVYAPSAASMYPEGFQTHVEPGPLAGRFEGEMRPGHFRGVATVITKIFAATRPSVAVFGQKDFQQLAVIRQLVADLDLGVRIVGVPTIREPDGLAISSRNKRLDSAERSAAIVLSKGLQAGEAVFDTGERSSRTIIDVVRQVIETEPIARIEYLEVVDCENLEMVSTIAAQAVVLVAARFGETRLIDNVMLG